MPAAYSWDFKAEVLAVYEVDGPSAAGRAYGVHAKTVNRWARQCGVATGSATKEATESALAMCARLREELRVEVLRTALAVMRRLAEPYEAVVMADGKPAKVKTELPPAKETRDLAWAAAVMFDKVRLEAGQPTERTETITSDMLDREIARLEKELADASVEG